MEMKMTYSVTQISTARNECIPFPFSNILKILLKSVKSRSPNSNLYIKSFLYCS